MCLYFHEKLQNLLSSKRTIEILYEKKNERPAAKHEESALQEPQELGDLQVRTAEQPDEPQQPDGHSVELLEVREWGKGKSKDTQSRLTPKPSSANQLEPRLPPKSQQTSPSQNADVIYQKMRKERATKMAIYMEIQESKDASSGVN